MARRDESVPRESAGLQQGNGSSSTRKGFKSQVHDRGLPGGKEFRFGSRTRACAVAMARRESHGHREFYARILFRTQSQWRINGPRNPKDVSSTKNRNGERNGSFTLTATDIVNKTQTQRYRHQAAGDVMPLIEARREGCFQLSKEAGGCLK